MLNYLQQGVLKLMALFKSAFFFLWRGLIFLGKMILPLKVLSKFHKKDFLEESEIQADENEEDNPEDQNFRSLEGVTDASSKTSESYGSSNSLSEDDSTRPKASFDRMEDLDDTSSSEPKENEKAEKEIEREQEENSQDKKDRQGSRELTSENSENKKAFTSPEEEAPTPPENNFLDQETHNSAHSSVSNKTAITHSSETQKPQDYLDADLVEDDSPFELKIDASSRRQNKKPLEAEDDSPFELKTDASSRRQNKKPLEAEDVLEMLSEEIRDLKAFTFSQTKLIKEYENRLTKTQEQSKPKRVYTPLTIVRPSARNTDDFSSPPTHYF